MQLTPGSKLGPYEIQSPLGAGGMGEVYRARDTRLDRTVAIKILPQEMSCDPLRKQRFEREAKTISSLNHPHICVLHDVGLQDGLSYLVMECLEGETLAKRLEKGPMPLEQVLKFGAQIADAMDKAHRGGVVHRDLKPGNIMLTSSGAKLLDFGLAKEAASLANLATMTVTKVGTPVTQEGTIVGTFQYMSPEQVEGKDLDGRSDIFSLGAVLYEMLTGKRAFEGKSQLSVASAILEKEPAPISTVLPMAPASLWHAVQRCLAKDPEERWQTARDLALELDWVAETRGETDRSKVAEKNAAKKWIVWSIPTLALVAAALSFLLFRPSSSAFNEPLRFVVPSPELAQIAPGPPWGSPLAVSPDGRRLVFVAMGKDGIRRLWVRPLDTLSARVLPGTEGASAPFWSPDSERVAYFADGKVMRIAASGGEPQTLCECQSGGGGGAWGRDGVILFSPAIAGHSGLFRISSAGGAPTRVTSLDASAGETHNVWPMFLPDGRHFLYNLHGGRHPGIYVGDLNSPERPAVLLRETNELSTLGYTSLGYLLYAEGRVLFAHRFDTKRLLLEGSPIQIVEGVYNAGPGAAAFSVSATGVLAYWGGAKPGTEQLLWVRRDGSRIASVGSPEAYSHFSLSPDGKRLALVQFEAGESNLNTNVWLLDASGGTPTKFTFEGRAGMPVWSPDSSRIVFGAMKGGPPSLFQRSASNVLAQDELLVNGGDNHPTDWSKDGHTIVYEMLEPKTRNDLWLVPASGEHKPVPFLQTPYNETGGRISPDGKWMAYTSDESGRDEIYVTNYPEPHDKRRISSNGGVQVEWRRDGHELFFRTSDRKLMAVEIKLGPSFDAGIPKMLFELPPEPPTWLQGGGDQRVYAPSGDGQRFLIGVPVSEGSSLPITVVMNWDVELKKK